MTMDLAAEPNTTDFISKLEELPRLRSFPAVATQLISVCEDENTNARDLVEIIRCDPNLAVELLRVSNSSMYGFGGRIKSIDHAAVVLGFRAVKNLTMSVAAASVFADGDAATAERRTLWQHSLASATVAKLLADCVPNVDAEEAFLAGMVHDVGKLLFFDLVPDEYQYSPHAIESTPTVDEERRDFGIDHAQVGGRCGQEWGLPGDIGQAILFHHAPESDDSALGIVDIVYAANRLSKAWGIGVEKIDVEAENLDIIPACRLSMEEKTLREIENAAPEEFDALTAAFSV